MAIGRKHKVWTKEDDEKLLLEIQYGKTLIQLSILMGTSIEGIEKRIHSMGFEGIKDARLVLGG